MTLASPLKTVMGNHGDIRAFGRKGRTMKVKASSGSATIFLGAWVTVTGETAGTPEVDLCAKTEIPAGIIIAEYGSNGWIIDLDKDSDSPYADGTYLVMYVPLPGDEIYMTVKTNTAITANTPVYIDGGFLVGWSYADGTQETDVTLTVVGTNLKTITAVASTEKVTLVRCK